MKKKLRILALIALGAVWLRSRRAGEFTVDSGEEGTVMIKAARAREDDWAVSGSLEVTPGKHLRADYAFTEGELTVILLPAGDLNGESTLQEMEEQLSDDNGFELNFCGTGTDIFELPEDTYYVKVIAGARATGEAILTVE
ncbi:MAG: hypothetical protein K5911_00040 [Eubacteriales bacterium]|nr:hypothetical protein [Eubacteriales bacterium]